MMYAVMLATDSLVLQVFLGERERAHRVAEEILQMKYTAGINHFLRITSDGETVFVGPEDLEKPLKLPPVQKTPIGDTEFMKADATFIQTASIKAIHVVPVKDLSEEETSGNDSNEKSVRGSWWMQ